MEQSMEQSMSRTEHTERILGGAFRDYVRGVLAGRFVRRPRVVPQRPATGTPEQRWEDEGGSSR